jgi:putative membrane protein
MIRLPFGAAPILLSNLVLGLAACSDDSSSSLQPGAATSSTVTSTGASSDLPPQVVVGTGTGVPLRIAGLTADGVNFLYQAGFIGSAALQIGQLAASHAASPRVIDTASILIRDYSLEDASLDSVGNAKGVVPPAVADSGRQAAATVLQGLQGAMFDRQYVEQQITDQRVALALFGAEAERGQDPDLRAFAQQYLPTLQSHLDQLTALASQRLISSR